MPDAVTQSAPQPAQAPSEPSVHERIKASLFGSRSQPADASPPEDSDVEASGNRKASSGVAPERASSDRQVPNEAADTEEVEALSEDQADAEADETDADDAQSEEVQPRTLKELAEAIGWDVDRMSDLELPVKIDGKEGTARLRDLVKSYQLDGHINQKLATLDTDRKTFESKRQESERAVADRLLKLDAGVKTLERALAGEFSSVDWQKLQTESPEEFNRLYVGYQTRYAALNDIAGQIAQEQQRFQTDAQAKAKERSEEEFKLLQAKVPEWSDSTRRAKDKADIVDYLKGVGISKEEFEQIGDHRQLLVVRDAWKWNQLQKSKPATLNKVKAAPKLLKPGAQQSRAVVDGLARKRETDTLRQTGLARHAVPLLKRQLFGNSR